MGFVLIFDGGLKRASRGRLIVIDLFGGLSVGVEVCGKRFTLRATLDQDCLRVGKFDFNVLLADPWKLPIKMVVVRMLFDVEFWRERARGGESGVWRAACLMVVHESEERREIAVDKMW